MNIIISPYSNKLLNGKRNAKNYPYWRQLISMLHEHTLTQIGITGEEQLVSNCLLNLKMQVLRDVLLVNDLFISVDNFLPHFAHLYNKRGIVLFSKSDPKIFGYPENINLLRDPNLLRPAWPDQFDSWQLVPYTENAFVKPERVVHAVNHFRG